MKTGIIVPLHKKGAENNTGNFRVVCLLSMISRILARVSTFRLTEGSEKHAAIDDNQDGFRRNISKADATQVPVRLHEDKRRLEEKNESGMSVGYAQGLPPSKLPTLVKKS